MDLFESYDLREDNKRGMNNKLGYGPPMLATPVDSHLYEIQTIHARSDTAGPAATFIVTFDSETTAALQTIPFPP